MSTATISPGLAGYTGNISVFQFTSYLDPSSDQTRVLWDFGDGTYSTTPVASHVYNWPGIYTVNLTTYGSGGTVYQNTFTQNISIQNLIPDIITVSPNIIINIPAGRLSLPLYATRQNSWQSYPAVSADGYTFNFFVSGSLSNKLNLNNLPTSKWAHIDRTWRFVVSATTLDGDIQYLPVDNIVTSNTEIYYKNVNQQNVNQQPVRCNATDLSAVFVGTSGIATFYYIDDTPKNYDSTVPPVFFYISLDTTKFPDSYQVITSQIAQNTFYPELELFQHIKGVISARIRYNAAGELIFTSCGLTEIPISQHKWQNTEIPFFINFVDETGAIVVNYPPLTINTNSQSSSALDVVNLQLVDSNYNPISADFFTTVDEQLPPSISGTFRGYFIPYEIADGATLLGSVTVFNPPSIQFDTTVGWVAYPDTDTIFKVTSEESSFYTYTSAGPQLNLSKQETDTYTSNKLESILAIAVAPSASPDISVDPYIWLGDSNSDTLIKFSTQGQILNTISLDTLLNANSDDKFSPSYISLDVNNNIWVTLYDHAETIKIDVNTGNLLLTVVPSVTNVSFTSANITNTFGGSNLVEPGIVDVDLENNPWICYTHPLCAFIEKYDGTTGSILSTYPLPQGVSPTDMVIDQFNNVYVIAGFFTSINPETFTIVSPITAQKLLKVNDNFGQFQFTFNTSISSFLTSGYHYTFTANNLSDSYYNGTHLVESISGNSITVEPHPMAYEFASTVSVSVSSFNPLLSASQGTLSSTFTCSDRLYKITPNGVMNMIDGFYAPSYITVDISQNVWISHCLTRISKVNVNTNYISTNFTVGSTEYVLETVQESNYIINDPTNFLIRLLVDNPHDRVFQHIEGITCDTFGILWVINDFEGRMYYIPTDNLTISATITTDFPPPLSGDYDFLTRKTYQAFGDWNGMRWINKYSGVETIQTLSGSTTFDILPASGLYTIAKINEDFDASEMYKSLRYTDRLLNAQNLFDNFIGQSVGDNNADATTLGKLIYERIANFPSNIADVDTCDVTALYALCDELNIPIDNYQFLFPANLKRIFNLVSIKHSKLWGDRNKFNRNFKNNFSQNTNYAKNIGPQIDVLTYTVSAGTNLVFNQLFDNEFKLITTMVLNAYVSGGATYTYPLSTYNQNWGWGLENGITGPEIVKYYNVYEYVPTYENSQEEGVIDWQNPLNNLVETASGIDVWLKDDGIVDTLLDYQIRKGLRMFI